MSFPASSLKVILSAVFLEQMNSPSSNNTSSGWTSHNSAARSFICLTTSSAAAMVALPVSKVILLPNDPAVNPIESVSTTEGETSSGIIPRASAACIARDTRLPDRSAEPVIRLIVPLSFTWMEADEPFPPACMR